MTNQKSRLLTSLSLAVFILSSPILAEDKLVATVNGEKITESDVKFATEDLAGAIPAKNEDAKRKYVIDYLVDMKLASRAAITEKLNESPEFKQRMAYANDRALMEIIMVRDAKKAITPEAMQAFYVEQVKSVKPETEVRARHILIVEEEDAKKALARVKGGEDFAKVANELSTDPGSGKEGGDLGYFTKQRMVPEFAEAAFSTEVGQISNIVKSQFGYHIIKVEDKREKKAPSFDQLKERIEEFLTQKAQQDVVLKLRQAAKIERVGEVKMEIPPVEAKKP
jgi:peptidyl-prolyl cis-trans isomerase C